MPGDPIDVETIRQSARWLPDFRTAEEAEEHGLILQGHVQLLLLTLEERFPGMEALCPHKEDGRDPGSPKLWIFRFVRRTLGEDYGSNVDSAWWHAENLALCCRILLLIFESDEYRKTLLA